MDIDGDRLAIGAPFGADGGCSGTGGLTGIGIVQIHERSSGVWMIDGLVANPGACRLRFGRAVAIRGNQLVVGQSADFNGGPEGPRGKMLVYRRGDSAWVPLVEITGPNDGNWGGFGSDDAMPSLGVAVDVMELSGGLLASVGGAPNRFVDLGSSFAIEGGGVVVDEFDPVFDDCDGDDVQDDCAILADPTLDCNGDGEIDSCQIAENELLDANGNGILDECDPDCNRNDVPDFQDIEDGTSLDLDGNGIPDECWLDPPVELYWIVDTSGSTEGELADICAMITSVDSMLEASGVPRTVTVRAIVDPFEPTFTCLSSGLSIVEQFGAEVPGAPSCCEIIADSESWLSACAIVSDRHLWREPLRFVLPVSDECGWEGTDPLSGECDASDEAVLDAASIVLECDGTIALPVATSGTSMQVRDHMHDFANLTDGYLTLLGTPAQAAAEIVAAIELRRARYDANDDGVVDSTGQFVLPGPGVVECVDPVNPPAQLIDCDDDGIADFYEILVDLADIAPAVAASICRLDVNVDELNCIGDCRLDVCQDGCQPQGDADLSGLVGFDDLLLLLADWGPCVGCMSDFNGDGDSGFDDLLIVLANWGWCTLDCGPKLGTPYPAPTSIMDCYQRVGGDPQKLAACIEAMILAETP